MERKVLALSFGLLVVVCLSIVLGLIYLRVCEERDEILNELRAEAFTYLIYLRDDLSTIVNYLTHKSVTVEVPAHDNISPMLKALERDAHTLSMITWILYDHTGEEKYYKLYKAFRDLKDFLIDILNDSPQTREERAQEHLMNFTDIEHILDEIIHEHKSIDEIAIDVIDLLISKIEELLK